MKIQMMLAVLFCKMSRTALRLFGRGGTDLPGRIALKICPNLLGLLAKNVTTVIVTGTNGKTTTSRMIEQSWRNEGISFFANKSGANLLSGVTAEFAANSTLFGKCKYSHALIESDEAALKYITRYVSCKAFVVTNVFRDQLDRYGEVTHTLDNLRLGIENCKDATLILNADDSLCTSLHDGWQGQTIFYGVNTPIYQSRVEELSDAPYCIHCKNEYEYSYKTYGHLGSYRCPNCGYCRPEPQVAVDKIYSSDAKASEVCFTVDGKSYDAKINLPGGYNIYNACACMAAGKAMGIAMHRCAESLSSFCCGFGRMEQFSIYDTPVRMILIKNPAGCNQVLNFLSQQTSPFVFTVLLNDRAQDGRDVSWIWDVDFERLTQMQPTLRDIYVSGLRAEDMALRFLYAGFSKEKIHMVKDHAELLKQATALKLPVFVMPTYTAMISLRSYISKSFGYREFWK